MSSLSLVWRKNSFHLRRTYIFQIQVPFSPSKELGNFRLVNHNTFGGPPRPSVAITLTSLLQPIRRIGPPQLNIRPYVQSSLRCKLNPKFVIIEFHFPILRTFTSVLSNNFVAYFRSKTSNGGHHFVLERLPCNQFVVANAT
ncbi:MAG: hypothetical protein ACTS4T_01430 [Candidatus Hodgkinia cicadicola]